MRIKKTILSLLMCMALAGSIILGAYQPVSAGEAGAVKDAGAATTADAADAPATYLDKNERVTILDADAFIHFIDSINNGTDYSGTYVSLRADVDLSGHVFTGSGTFRGTFDGHGFTVSNFRAEGGGLFGVLQDAAVKNLTIENAIVTNDAGNAGAIAGSVSGISFISNCVIADSVSVSGQNAGGIAGLLTEDANVTLAGCISHAAVSASNAPDSSAGGILGRISPKVTALVDNCINRGTVSGGQEGSGGIIGCAQPVFVTNCTNEGTVNNAPVCGGILGSFAEETQTQDTEALIFACVNNGAVHGEDISGGIVGKEASGTLVVLESKNNAAIGSEVCTVSGGILGSGVMSALDGCSNQGTVNASADGYAGGVCGRIEAPILPEASALIHRCSGGEGEVLGGSAGRLIGSVEGGSGNAFAGSTVVYLAIDDTNADAYDTLPSVGCVGAQSDQATLLVEEGTLHGVPGGAQNEAHMIFEENAVWQDAPDGTDGSLREYRKTPADDWSMERWFSRVENSAGSGCGSEALRRYYAKVESTVTDYFEGPSDTDTIQPVKLSYTKKGNEVFCTFVYENAKSGRLLTMDTLDDLKVTLSYPDGFTFNGCNENTQYMQLNFKFNAENQDLYETLAPVNNELSVTAENWYRRDSDRNIYDGSDPNYPKTDLVERAVDQKWNDNKIRDIKATVWVNFIADSEDQIEELIKQVKVGFGFENYYTGQDGDAKDYLLEASGADPQPLIGVIEPKSETRTVWNDPAPGARPVVVERKLVSGHRFRLERITDSTCVMHGAHTFLCDRCGEERTFLMPTTDQHEFSDASTRAVHLKTDEGIYLEPTDTKIGIGRYVCEQCNASEVYWIAKIEHYLRQPDGSYQLRNADTELVKGLGAGDTVQATDKTTSSEPAYKDYVLNSGRSVLTAVVSDNILPDPIVLKVYYDRKDDVSANSSPNTSETGGQGAAKDPGSTAQGSAQTSGNGASKTGENFPMVPMAVAMLSAVSAAGILIVLKRTKKRA